MVSKVEVAERWTCNEATAMKVYIVVDSEGQACITRERGAEGRYGTFQAEYNRRRATDEAAAAVRGAQEAGASDILVHDAHAPNPSAAFALSRLSHGPYGPTPMGIFRDVQRSSYEQDVKQQLVDAQEKTGPGDLSQLIRSQGTWTVS